MEDTAYYDDEFNISDVDSDFDPDNEDCIPSWLSEPDEVINQKIMRRNLESKYEMQLFAATQQDKQIDNFTKQNHLKKGTTVTCSTNKLLSTNAMFLQSMVENRRFQQPNIFNSQACAQNNLTVANKTTVVPKNHQYQEVIGSARKPNIIRNAQISVNPKLPYRTEVQNNGTGTLPTAAQQQKILAFKQNFLQNRNNNMINQQNGVPSTPIEPKTVLVSLNTNTKIVNQPSCTVDGQADDDEADYEEIGVAETYADYCPVKLQFGARHPDSVVETASLSSVEPMDIYYKLMLPQETILNGKLSALQLEAIVYASQAHEHMLPDGTRTGFFLGDGAGVGKGRTIAGIIYENFLRGRKRALWISVSNDLKYDAMRDLHDIGADGVGVYPLNKFKYSKIASRDNRCKRGVVFCTYASLIGESNTSTNKYRSRFKQLLQWCGRNFDGVIVFDECHKAKNLSQFNAAKSTKTGLTVLELQHKLPKARVVYASATGASEPKNMGYMVRLGLWGDGTSFPTFNDFMNAVDVRGVGAMEIVAMDLKLRGMYIARQLSFKDVSFRIEEVPLTKEFRLMYNQAVDLWVQTMNRFTEASKLIGIDKCTYKVIWCQFWCAHQRFFKYLCIASKVHKAVSTAKDAIKHGKCVVIGLQSTGESRTLDQLERDDGELKDFVSTAKNIFLAFVEKHFPAPDRKSYNHLRLNGEIMSTSTTSAGFNVNKMFGAKKRRLNLNELANELGFYDVYMSDGENEDVPDFNNPSDTDSEDISIKLKEQRKRKKGRPRRTEEKVTAQSRILELLQRRLGYAKNKEVYRTDANGMPVGPKTNIETDVVTEKDIERAIRLREGLLRRISKLGDSLPPNTLDQLIDELGGPDNVAEMTGRRGRVIQTFDGTIKYETRYEADVPMETVNIIEKQRFMNGEKDVAIISEAASSGISLQSDRRCMNQRRRVHITLELPWSADRAVQQFGRTHRSNEVNAPEYIFFISDLAGERRFASTVAKRLESLGALTHGDRRATDTRDLSQFNIDNKYGRSALEAVMKAIIGESRPIVPPPADYQGDFFADCTKALLGVGMILKDEEFPEILYLDKEYNNISKFLNRILGCHVELQNSLFKYFTDTMNCIISQMKRTGRFDLGILDLGAHGENVTLLKLVRFIRKHATGVAPTELYTVSIERGLEWEEALKKYVTNSNEHTAFYITRHQRNGKRGAILAIEEKKKLPHETWKRSFETMPSTIQTPQKERTMLRIYRPNTGLQVRLESLAAIERRYTKVSRTEVAQHWHRQYTESLTGCTHMFWGDNCRLKTDEQDCQVGLRNRIYHVLSGSVLPIWSRIEYILDAKTVNSKLQVIRLKTTTGKKVVGTVIPKSCYEQLVDDLKTNSQKMETFQYNDK